LNLPSLRPRYIVSCWIIESHGSIWTQTGLLYPVSSSNPVGISTIAFFGVKRLKCGISGTFCASSRRWDRITEFRDSGSKIYIRYNSDQESSLKFISVSEISQFVHGSNRFWMFEGDHDVFRNAREVNIVQLIIQRVSGNFCNDLRSWHRVGICYTSNPLYMFWN
jgi:hypothetical protein